MPHQTGSVIEASMIYYTNILILFPLISRVCICGYPRQQMRRYKGINTRLTVTSDFLVQLITGIHYALYGHTHAIMLIICCNYTCVFMLMHRCNGEVELGSKALDDVLYRAQLELLPEPLLVGEILFLRFYFLFFIFFCF